MSAATVEVKSGHALLEVLNFAAGQRVTCTTLKNTDSSRSHAFYRLYMQPRGGKGIQHQTCWQEGMCRSCHAQVIRPRCADNKMLPVVPATGTKQQRCGSITFVDLAGSERSGDSTYHSKEQIKQTADINTSLSALKV